MSILLIFISWFLFVSAASELLPCVICTYSGTLSNSKYTFSVADVPERCKAVMYSGYDMSSASMADSDTNVITSLVSAGKIVFTSVTFPSKINGPWGAILNSNLESSKDVENLITFLQTNKINGVILDMLGVFDGIITDFACKLNAFISKLKKDIPSLLIGIYLNAYDVGLFGNKNIFDFSVTNNNIDLYVIDYGTTAMRCNTNTAKTGKYILTGSSNVTTTLEQVIDGMTTSPMDQNKLVMGFMVSGVTGEGDASKITPYTEYCSRSDDALWCIETSQMYYDQVKMAKSSINGIMISMLDDDDNDGTCGCGKFTVTNTYIDAWEGKNITSCDKLVIG